MKRAKNKKLYVIEVTEFGHLFFDRFYMKIIPQTFKFPGDNVPTNYLKKEVASSLKNATKFILFSDAQKALNADIITEQRHLTKWWSACVREIRTDGKSKDCTFISCHSDYNNYKEKFKTGS